MKRRGPVANGRLAVQRGFESGRSAPAHQAQGYEKILPLLRQADARAGPLPTDGQDREREPADQAAAAA
jgi:hypothetical protein